MHTKDKLGAALNEARMLVLGAQIVLGFQFEAIFQHKFSDLPRSVQGLTAVAVVLIVLALGLLLAPVPYHRLVAGGNNTAETRRFTTRMVAVAPLPFAACISLDIFIVNHTPFG